MQHAFDTIPTHTLADRLTAARIKANLTIEELSTRTGYNKQKVLQYESGQCAAIPLDYITAAAHSCNVSYITLAKGEFTLSLQEYHETLLQEHQRTCRFIDGCINKLQWAVAALLVAYAVLIISYI